MQASKIGSVNTYLRCLKELDSWGYIKYQPSHNPMKGSLVYLYTFDKSSDTTNNITTNTTTDNGNNNTSNKSDKTTIEKVLRPSINSSNNTNKPNKKNEHGHARKKNNPKSTLAITKLFVNEPESKTKKIVRKKQEAPTPRFTRPLLKSVQDYFDTKAWPGIEAEKFFNYYQSNGWLVGGKTQMRSWKACASNWMLNAEKFSNGKAKPTAGKLNATTRKDYSEPL